MRAMPLFVRRVLQRILDASAGLLTRDQLAEHVKRLNASGSRVLQTEWEVVLIHAFSRLGMVAYERPLSNGTKPDLTVTSPAWSFVAEIVTVSDAGFHDQNPYEDSHRFVIEQARRHGLTGAGLDIGVDGTHEGTDYYHRRMRLALPRTDDERAAFALALDTFLEEIAANPRRLHSLRFINGRVRLTIGYTPGRRSISGNYPSYTTAYGIENSPIYRALEDKARQLREADASMPRGIIVCDGDCASLGDLRGSPNGFGLRQIVSNFLGRHAHVDFVLCLAVKRRWSSLLNPLPTLHVVEPTLFVPERAKSRVTALVAIALQSVVQHLPRVSETPRNALALAKVEHRARTRYASGGWKMADPEVRISARALLNLLTGSVSQKEFMEAHGFVRTRDGHGPPPMNPFKMLSQGGRLLAGAHIEEQPDRDDDWIVFKFGRPDPAVGSFTIKRSDC